MEEDRILAETLMGSHKEREEHNLVMEQIIRKLEPIILDFQYPSSPQLAPQLFLIIKTFSKYPTTVIA